MVWAIPVTKRRKKRKSSIVLPSWLDRYVTDAKDWCKGRMWWPRLLLLLLFAHLAVCHLRDPLYQDFFKGINLGFHEIGHVVFSPLGQFMGIAGGSIFQCAVPLLSTIMFFRQRDYFGIAVCFGWLSTNLFDVASYADDSRKLALPLVSPFGGGDETIHDWNYILDNLNLLQYDYVFANALRLAAVISTLVCICAGGLLVFLMANYRKPKSDLVPSDAPMGAQTSSSAATD